MSAESFAATLPFAVLAACLFRARPLALALVPPCALIIARSLELVDISSASHPLRWIVPVSCAGLAGMAAAQSQRRIAGVREKLRWFESLPEEWHGVLTDMRARRKARSVLMSPAPPLSRHHRALVASILVLGSCAPDLLALHPFFWARFAEWPLVPVQIAVCSTILVVLLSPERWVVKWTQ